MNDVHLLRGRLVLPDRVEDDGVVEVRGTTLGYVGPAHGWNGPAPRAVGTIAPGFIDIHCHGGGGATVTSGDAEDVARVGAHHLRHGTTTMLASLVSAAPDDLRAGVATIEAATASSANVIGSHLEGPFLAPGHCGAHDPALLQAPDPALAAELLATGRGTVRMITLAPELPGCRAVAEAFVEAGAVVSLGHTDADATTFAAGFASHGATSVTHLFNGMAPMHHRAPGPVAASLTALADGTTYVELIADGRHLDDRTVAMVFALDRHRKVVLVSDAMAAAGMPDGDYRLGAMDVRVEGGAAFTRTATPSIAGGTSHLADIVRRCITSASISPEVAVAAATSAPAVLLGLDDRGRLASGLRADLVVLDDDWSVDAVMHDGAWLP